MKPSALRCRAADGNRCLPDEGDAARGFYAVMHESPAMSETFVDRIARAFLGTVSAQVIMIGVTFLLVHLCSPADAGAFSAWLFFAVVVTGRYGLGLLSDGFHAGRKLVLQVLLVLATVVALWGWVAGHWMTSVISHHRRAVSFGFGVTKFLLCLLALQQSVPPPRGCPGSLGASIAIGQVFAAYVLGSGEGSIHGRALWVGIATTLAALCAGKRPFLRQAHALGRSGYQVVGRCVPKFSLSAGV